MTTLEILRAELEKLQIEFMERTDLIEGEDFEAGMHLSELESAITNLQDAICSLITFRSNS